MTHLMQLNKSHSLEYRKVTARLCVFLTALLVLLSGEVQSHDLNITGVARVFLDESEAGNYRLSIADQQVPPLYNIERILPERCQGLEPSQFSYRFQCQPALDASDKLTFPWRFQGVVVLARWRDGNEVSAFFPSRASQIEVPLAQLKASAGSLSGLGKQYLILGAEHILFGIDHLLFVLGLLLLLRGFKMLVTTVTAFTLAHSITLGAAVLGIFPLAGPPIEALIALSIVFLAREILMGRQGKKTLVHSKPWIVAFGFGLIHGFGFAGALGELGLASRDIPLALLFFNLGVEVGQVGFVLTMLMLAKLFEKGAPSWYKPAEMAIAYGLGGVALFWFAERLPPLLLV